MLKYHPYISDKPGKKHYIITNDNKKVYFGQAGAEDYTIHKDEKRKQLYINRHKANENHSDPNTAGYWSRWYLWEHKTKGEALKNIKSDLKKKGFL